MKTVSSKFCAAVCGLALIVSACGSDDDDSTAETVAATDAAPESTAAPATDAPTTDAPSVTDAPTTDAPAPTDPPEPGTEIVIGTLLQAEGPLSGDDGKQAIAALDAWEAWVNAEGGINGHPVRLIIEDDGGVPAVAQQKVEEMLSEGAVAFVAVQSPLRNFVPFLEEQGVPMVGGLNVASDFVDHTNYWASSGSGPRVGSKATVGAAKAGGATAIGIMACAETPACAQAAAVYETVAPAEGLEYKGAQVVAASDPNYSAQCLALKETGADAVALFVGSATAIRIAEDCSAQDYQPVWVGSTFDKSFATVAEFEGMVGYALTAPWFLSETPGQQLFQDIVGSTIDDLSPTSEQYGKTTAITWSGLRLFQLAAEAATAGGDDLTSDGLTEAIKAITPADSTMDGFVGEIDYSRPSTQQGGCYYVVALEGGTWTAPSGSEPVCVP